MAASTPPFYEGTQLRRITLDLGHCSGCEACSSLGPDVFAWDADTERPRQLKELVPAGQAQELISYCPGDCISFDDDDEDFPHTD